jgi:chromosome segregation ATPase
VQRAFCQQLRARLLSKWVCCRAERAVASDCKAAAEQEVHELKRQLHDAHGELHAAHSALADTHRRAAAAEAMARDTDAAAAERARADAAQARAPLQRRAEELQHRVWQLVRVLSAQSLPQWRMLLHLRQDASLCTSRCTSLGAWCC